MTASTSHSAVFAYRSGDALGFAAGPPQQSLIYAFQENTQNAKLAQFSDNGKYFGWLCANGLVVADAETKQIIRMIEVKSILDFSFSPLGSFISTFERLVKQADESLPPNKNVKIWNVQTGQEVAGFTHKNQENWTIQWTEDESYCARLVRNEVQFHSAADLSKPHSRLILEGVTVFSLSPGKNPSVAVFVPEKKGAPAIVRLYGLNSFNYPLSNKTFYKADSIQFKWNRIGTNVLVMTHTDTDRSGLSYYGETNLYYLSAVGNYDCRVMFDAEGPIHDIAWGPNSSEFIVVYGNMPAKAALFDSRANKIFDFGSSPKNYVRYSPHGRLIVLAGFGNLAGYMEVWDRKNLRMVSRFQEPAAVYCEFLPNATQILTATLSPRLRVDNRFRVRSYTGEIVWEVPFKELFQVIQCPSYSGFVGKSREQLEAAEMALTISQGQMDTTGTSGVSKLQEGGSGSVKASNGAYVPPHLRAKMGNTSSGSLKTSGGASKANEGPQSSVNGKPSKPSGTEGRVADLEKQVVGFQRKLRQIDGLKQKQSDGQILEKNQLDKLESESKLRAELKCLEEQLSKLRVE